MSENKQTSNVLGVREMIQKPEGTLVTFHDGSTALLAFNAKHQTQADKAIPELTTLYKEEVAKSIDNFFKNATLERKVAFNAGHMHDARTIELNSGHYSEFADRAHIINCNITQHLIEHPIAQHYPDIHQKLLEATMLIGEAYQLACELEHETGQ